MRDNQSAMISLIVFDCDGVLFDSREANRAYYNDLLALFNCSPMSEAELDYVHSHNVNDAVHHIFVGYPDIDMNQVNLRRDNLDYEPYLSSMIMAPDLPRFLDTVAPLYRLAISTNRSTTMTPLLERFELTGYFEKVVTPLDVAHPKPAPDALLEIFAHFDCGPEDTIFIGDSEVDRLHARNSGVDLIAFRNQELEARYHVDCFMDILALPPFLHKQS